MYQHETSPPDDSGEGMTLLGRYPTGRLGGTVQTIAFLSALFLSAALFLSVGQTILEIVFASITGSLILIFYRLRVLLKLFSSSLTYSPVLTSTGIPRSGMRRNLRNVSVLLIGFFGPFAALYVLDASTWVILMLAIILGATGEELFNFISCRTLENRRRLSLHYFVKSQMQGGEMRAVASGIAALRKDPTGRAL